MLKLLNLRLLMLLLTAGAAYAGAAQPRADLRASELFSREVATPGGERLGRIDDVLIDPRDGRVRYAVLESGLLDKRRYPYPLTAFRPEAGGGRMVLDVEASALEDAPGFDRAGKPSWEVGSLSAAALMGREVRSPSGRRAGEVKDLILDLGGGSVRHVVVDYDPVFGDADLRVPLQKLRIPAGDGPVTLGEEPEPRAAEGYVVVPSDERTRLQANPR